MKIHFLLIILAGISCYSQQIIKNDSLLKDEIYKNHTIDFEDFIYNKKIINYKKRIKFYDGKKLYSYDDFRASNKFETMNFKIIKGKNSINKFLENKNLPDDFNSEKTQMIIINVVK
ncbi:MAG: hypothetical protein RI558_09725 [Psychroflexus sp.]|jgi:hypothetical protein|nr:hypothetical protein [Psychroflexus sp.]